MAPLPCPCQLRILSDGPEQGAYLPLAAPSEAVSGWWQLHVSWFGQHVIILLTWRFGPGPLCPDITRLW